MKLLLLLLSLTSIAAFGQSEPKTKTKTKSKSETMDQTTFKREPVFTAPDGTVYHSGINRDGVHNDIELKSTNLIVKRAYLTDAKGNELQENVVGLKEPVKLNIELFNSWTEVNGRVYLGATQVALTDKGTAVEGGDNDVYAANEAEGFDAKDGHFVNLWLSIDEIKEPTEFYTVTFRFWDKKGDGEVTGSYKFKVK